jgi:hypothetical protein
LSSTPSKLEMQGAELVQMALGPTFLSASFANRAGWMQTRMQALHALFVLEASTTTRKDESAAVTAAAPVAMPRILGTMLLNNARSVRKDNLLLMVQPRALPVQRAHTLQLDQCRLTARPVRSVGLITTTTNGHCARSVVQGPLQQMRATILWEVMPRGVRIAVLGCSMMIKAQAPPAWRVKSVDRILTCDQQTQMPASGVRPGGGATRQDCPSVQRVTKGGSAGGRTWTGAKSVMHRSACAAARAPPFRLPGLAILRRS